MDPVVFFDRAMMGHDPGPSHPESPRRLEALESALDAAGIDVESAGAAETEALLRVHSEAHVDSILSLRDEETSLDFETYVSANTVRAARLAAGSAVEAVDAVMGEAESAFALVRPPGHHAEPDRAMGFCIFNNIAIAAAHARARHGVERVLIFDWDVGQGNGTQRAFERDASVLFASFHHQPHVSGTGAASDVGEGDGLGYTVNVPFASEATDGDYVHVFDALIEPIAAEFQPELVLVSAGFNAHREEPLGQMNLSEAGFAALCSRMQTLARRYAQGRIALVLEGGYALDALTRSVLACLRVLAGEARSSERFPVSAAGERALREATAAQKPLWKLI